MSTATESKTVMSKVVTAQTSTSTKTISTKTSSSSMSFRSSSHQVAVSSGHQDSGLDIDGEIEKMRQKLDVQMGEMKREMFHLMPLEPSSSSLAEEVIKLDRQVLSDSAGPDSNKLRLDLDVHEFQSETVSIKSDGNKIEVHAKKQLKKGEDETNEEYSRVYELPSGVDAKRVTSSLQKDGNMLTIEVPVEAS